MVKIGFLSVGGESWPSGTIYATGLLRALRESFPKDIALCLITRERDEENPQDLRKLVDEVVVCPHPRRWSGAWVFQRLARRLTWRDYVSGLTLRRHRIDVIALAWTPPAARIPTISWLPDFQHLHLPEMFDREEHERRHRIYRGVARHAARVILLSEAVRRDFEQFAPHSAGKARVLPPVSYIPPDVYGEDPKLIARLYHLPEKYIYLPNQFWRHKNHLAAFHALRILKAKGVDVFLACSGYPGDERHPTYFADLLRTLSGWGLRDRVALLGMLPREHLFALMRQSVCVLNPSLFEGFGMTVDEARSVGKQVVLSDIPAHREQDPPRAIFFDPRDSEGLAARLEEVWRGLPPGPDAALEEEARRTLPERMANYARSFLAVVREVVNG